MAERHDVLEQLVEHTHEGFWYIDVEAKTLDVNPAMCRILDRAREEIIGRSVFEFVDQENLAILKAEIAARRAGTVSGTYELALLRPSGQLVPCINNAHSVWNDNGEPIGSIGLWTDISKLKDVEAELRQIRATLEERVEARTALLEQNERRLREAQKIARLSSWELDAGGKLTCADEVFDLLGADRDTFDGTATAFLSFVHPEDRDRVRSESKFAWDNLERLETTHRVVTRDEEIKTVRERATVLRDTNGTAYRLTGTVQDVSDQVATEARLRQAQRMEAIGQLTGGIAHDFNDLLGVIMGSAEFLQMSKSYDDELVSGILDATRRGAELTHQMLAYARRQPLNTTQFCMRQLIENKMLLLTRTLGATISVSFHVTEDVWNVLADPSQVEDALLNLVINARHAMPDGGNLIIECYNEVISDYVATVGAALAPGAYVVLSVSDDGVGMPPHVLEKATDPFFTTKGTEGSGLGLSMVFGFASQSGGHLSIYSEPEVGTTAKLYLPRGSGEVVNAPEPEATTPVSGRGERILVIEDDPAVRDIVERILVSLDYILTSAHDAASARKILATDTAFDLILSDVALPNGMTGPEFADELGTTHPGLRVVFMSGYPAVASEKTAGFGSDRVLIRKPFRRDAVARTLRQVLDRSANGDLED